MRVFIKLGGSLITDKRQESFYREEVVKEIAAELLAARSENPQLEILIGHGSGSFGHVAAKRYGTAQGVSSPEQWRGYAQVSNVASELNFLVIKTLEAAGLPVIRIQPSASLIARDGKVMQMATEPIENALVRGLLPVVHGDVSLDEVRGGTIISTEALFFYLASRLYVDRVLLLGEVPGVLGLDAEVVAKITPMNLGDVEAALGGSHGVDVTGGMETKVRDMVALVQQLPQLSICILGGLSQGMLRSVLLSRSNLGTMITSS